MTRFVSRESVKNITLNMNIMCRNYELFCKRIRTLCHPLFNNSARTRSKRKRHGIRTLVETGMEWIKCESKA